MFKPNVLGTTKFGGHKNFGRALPLNAPRGYGPGLPRVHHYLLLIGKIAFSILGPVIHVLK